MEESRVTKPVCGVLYLDFLRAYCGTDEVKQKAFAAGFIVGQCEKVYIGACKAAMFRPSESAFHWLKEVVDDAAHTYGLTVTTIPASGVIEIWVSRSDPDVSRMGLYQENSPEWHQLRARLCGIPADEVDTNFHERDGYAQKCDEG